MSAKRIVSWLSFYFSAVGLWGFAPASEAGQREEAVIDQLASIFEGAQSKRYHQETLRWITRGDAGIVRDFLVARLAEHPGEVESRFMLVLAHTRLGELEQAIEQMQRAVNDGLPPSRFVAGPRGILSPLFDRPEFLSLLERFKRSPVHGPMLGAVTDRSVSVWVRTGESQKVQLRLSGGEEEAAFSEVQTSGPETDFTAVLTVSGLQPLHRYEYTLLLNGEPSELTPGEVVTAAAEGSAGRYRFAFGGGAGYVPENEHVWETIRQIGPNSLVLLGDNVYIDDPTSPDMQHYTYYRRQSRPEWRDLVAAVPVYSIWDDHDFATNDSNGGPAVNEPPWKIPVWNVFRQNWVNPDYGGGSEQPGCWYDFYAGDIHFIMLDGRYYRDPAGGSMLGPFQKQWLKETLLASKGTFRILASPVPWAEGTKPGSRDTWDGFAEERKEIFDFISEHRIAGIVLISADRHRTDAYRIERNGSGAYDLFEFNSSRLTNQHVHPTMDHALFSFNETQSFGLVDIDTTLADPEVRYRVMTSRGEEVYSLTIKRSQLLAGTPSPGLP